MEFGVCLPNFPFGVQPTTDAIVAVAKSAERLGYDSVWATDHVLVPKDKPRYGNVFEAITTLAYLAGMTRRIRLGTSILVLPQRHAVIVAKEIATLDALSGGRVILGIGLGWIEDEFKTLGADFHRRGRHTDEALRVMKALWTETDPRFEGSFYRFGDVLFDPRPAQRGGPPIWLGGYSDATLRRTAALGDAWHADDMPIEKLRPMGERLQALAAQAARSVTITLRRTVDMRPAAATSGKLRASEAAGVLPGRWPGGTAGALSGSAEDIVAGIADAGTAGVTHFICQFEHGTLQELLVSLDVFAEVVMPRLKNA